MKPIITIIEIERIKGQELQCVVSDEVNQVHLVFHAEDSSIGFNHENELSETLRLLEFQLKKVLRSALKGKIKVGQIINCVFIEGFRFLSDADFYRYIRVDRRGGELDISTSDTSLNDAHKIFADGSFACETHQSGFGVVVESIDGKQDIFYNSFSDGSSNLMELLAVIEGLKQWQLVERIQVNTDSRFVIRGLVQWIHFWKHNNWQTAFGRDVKYANNWQLADKLCEGKLIEFRWIKGHSGHEEQSFCHDLARELARQKNKNL